MQATNYWTSPKLSYKHPTGVNVTELHRAVGVLDMPPCGWSFLLEQVKVLVVLWSYDTGAIN